MKKPAARGARGRDAVQAFGADGVLRRRRFTQEDADFLVKKGVAITLRTDRKRTRIICIQFIGARTADTVTKPEKWLRTGTRYTEVAHTSCGRRLIQHKRLPYDAADAATGRVGTPGAIDAVLRAMFMQVGLSIVAG